MLCVGTTPPATSLCLLFRIQLMMMFTPGNTGQQLATPVEFSSTGLPRQRRRRAAVFVAIVRSISSLALSAGRDDADDAITSLAPDHPSDNHPEPGDNCHKPGNNFPMKSMICASISNLHNLPIGEVFLFEKAGSLIF